MTDDPKPQTIDIVPGFAQALDIFATVLTDGTETGRREARAMLLDLGRQLDTWATNGALIRAKPGGKLEAVTDPGDWLETAACLWEAALDLMRPLHDGPASELLLEIRRIWGIAATRDMIARAAPECWAAYTALPEGERGDMAFDADFVPRWLAKNVGAIAVAAGHYDTRNP